MSRRRTVECSERFSGLVQKQAMLDDGSHKIKVRRRLEIGRFSLCQPEVAIIEDDQGRVLLIPEDTKCDGRNRLASRWNVKEDMKLRLTVEEGKISDVFIEG
jgi:hypothetical protein